MINEISTILSMFRECFSRKAAFHWFVIVIMGFILRLDHHGVSSIIRWLGLVGAFSLYGFAVLFQGFLLATQRYSKSVAGNCFIVLSITHG
jgi:hypothetical protein